MKCPECNAGELHLKYGETTEPGHEKHWEEWWECLSCGAKFSDEDLKRESDSAGN